MKTKFFYLAAVALLCSCGDGTDEQQDEDNGLDIAKHLPNDVFPDFGYMIDPETYKSKYAHEPIFHIKTDYPLEMPEEMPAFLDIDFKEEPLKYINAVRDYGFEGNIPSWDPYGNTKRDWYHIPWLHPTAQNQDGSPGYPPNGGTEGFHGLIKEAGLDPYQLGPDQGGESGDYSIYAITLINDKAGYAMGKMWEDPANPDFKVLDKRYGGGFPTGTVFMKLLFTTVPAEKVDYLKNPLTWTAYITPDFGTNPNREVGKVHLLQMDIAVRDPRADSSAANPDGTGWVFGTFCYNGNLNKKNKFMNLVPVGLMWGNDPLITENKTSPFPPKTEINPDLKQTVIFDSPNLPPQHLGWNGRLDGPADLNTVSCVSCHNAAQFPQITPLVPPNAPQYNGKNVPPPNGGDEEWMKWFQNVQCATSMNDSAYSMDFSFQVAIALQNFYYSTGPARDGLWASDYTGNGNKKKRHAPEPVPPKNVPPASAVISRDGEM